MTEFEKAMIEQIYKLNRTMLNILAELATFREIASDVSPITQEEYREHYRAHYDWIDQKDYYKDEYEIDVCHGKFDSELVEVENDTRA